MEDVSPDALFDDHPLVICAELKVTANGQNKSGIESMLQEKKELLGIRRGRRVVGCIPSNSEGTGDDAVQGTSSEETGDNTVLVTGKSGLFKGTRKDKKSDEVGFNVVIRGQSYKLQREFIYDPWESEGQSQLVVLHISDPESILDVDKWVRRCLSAGRPLLCYPAWEIEVNEFQLSEDILAKVAQACMSKLSASTVDGVTEASLGYVHMPTSSVLQFGESSFSGKCELSSKAVVNLAIGLLDYQKLLGDVKLVPSQIALIIDHVLCDCGYTKKEESSGLLWRCKYKREGKRIEFDYSYHERTEKIIECIIEQLRIYSGENDGDEKGGEDVQVVEDTEEAKDDNGGSNNDDEEVEDEEVAKYVASLPDGYSVHDLLKLLEAGSCDDVAGTPVSRSGKRPGLRTLYPTPNKALPKSEEGVPSGEKKGTKRKNDDDETPSKGGVDNSTPKKAARTKKQQPGRPRYKQGCPKCDALEEELELLKKRVGLLTERVGDLEVANK